MTWHNTWYNFVCFCVGRCIYLHGTGETSYVQILRWMCRGPMWSVVSLSHSKKFPPITLIYPFDFYYYFFNQSFLSQGTWIMEKRTGKNRHLSAWRAWKRKKERGKVMREGRGDEKHGRQWKWRMALYLLLSPDSVRRPGGILKLP